MRAQEVWGVCWRCYNARILQGIVFRLDQSDQAQMEHLKGLAGHKAFIDKLNEPVSLNSEFYCTKHASTTFSSVLVM